MKEEVDTLDAVFEQFLSNTRFFMDRDVLRHDYVPEKLPHREDQIRCLGLIVAPILRNERSSNVLVYGKTGTGKTAVMKYVLNRLLHKSLECGVPLKVAYVNCRLAGTEYRVFTSLCDELGVNVPFTGLAVGEVFDRFKKGLERRGHLLVVVLDELDELIKAKGDVLLYELTRVNEALSNSRVSVVGISNDLQFKELLEPRVLSSLSEEEVVFRPYDASELQDILLERAELAFHKDVLLDGALSLCAALAASEHGDARRALDLLRVAAEVAERENAKTITADHVRAAEKRIEHDRLTEALTNLTPHSKLCLYSVYVLSKANVYSATTGDIFEVYIDLCGEVGISPLTQRRVSGLVNELDAMGLLSARVISRGRYGRTKKISLAIPRTPVKEVYANDAHLGGLIDFSPDCLKQRFVKARY